VHTSVHITVFPVPWITIFSIPHTKHSNHKHRFLFLWLLSWHDLFPLPQRTFPGLLASVKISISNSKHSLEEWKGYNKSTQTFPRFWTKWTTLAFLTGHFCSFRQHSKGERQQSYTLRPLDGRLLQNVPDLRLSHPMGTFYWEDLINLYKPWFQRHTPEISCRPLYLFRHHVNNHCIYAQMIIVNWQPSVYGSIIP
jgi:hypothetical protein